VLTAPIDLEQTLQLTSGHAYVGFTAATGGAIENHDIRCWSLSQTPSRFFDTDEDSLPDWWEDLHFCGPTCADPDADPDLDDVNNLDEFILGTIPTNPTDFFRIEHEVEAGTGRMIITWEGLAGRTYTVESATSVTGSWTSVYEITPVGASRLTYTNALVGDRFLRVGVRLAH